MNSLYLTVIIFLSIMIALFLVVCAIVLLKINTQQAKLKSKPINPLEQSVMFFENIFDPFSPLKKAPLCNRTEEPFVWYAPDAPEVMRHPAEDGLASQTIIGTMNFKPKRFSTMVNLSDFEAVV
ncbi:Oidioi.mRNA.OKI2018_I69.chr2.g4689.t1.cds [Oikopleura dioica]|uniref:Oidioi.mRNA.OKI2018_I69.chr2.g4689.t1.cds n=1 Tax=Oikopleura dioica TaxID=34765 RepID=A0ABN7SXS0_OIKDI|nr:Oidioi.mRNA.OKI2018_I69.chr2.g4689.t1.cds [Oikopleura dioica]